ncbi:MAG: 50S ribosomal protein L25 [Bryobacteraceae bacterium]
MRKDITVAAQLRTSRGKNEARRLRARGLVPAVLYGAGREAVALAVEPNAMLKILHSNTGHNTIFDVAVQGGETTPVMIVDWQLDPIKDRLLHVDLKRIDMSKRLRVSVPVQQQGEAKGVKQQGGLLEIVTREIEIECLPDEIPEHFTVDVTGLMIGQALRAGEVPLSGSMKLLSPPDSVIAHVVALRREAATVEAAAPEAAAAEPEVIKKGKKEEEAGEAEEKGKKK